MRLIQLETRRRFEAASIPPRRTSAVVVPLRKTGAPTDYDDRRQEPETLMAALCLAAILLTLLTSLAMKLCIG
jgi:hypothetical protein